MFVRERDLAELKRAIEQCKRFRELAISCGESDDVELFDFELRHLNKELKDLKKKNEEFEKLFQ